MKIVRDDNTIIQKRKINFNNLEEYNAKKINKAKKILKDVVNNSYVNNFNYVSFMLDESLNNKRNLLNSKLNCISECKILKRKLNKIGLKTYYISCKAQGFSNLSGDNLVKEAHVFLVYPSLKNNKIFFTIFDPGFRMINVIQFYKEKNSGQTSYLIEGKIRVIYNKNNKIYPYTLKSNRRINYKKEELQADIKWNFNPYYETLDLNRFSYQLCKAMFYLKLMNYPKNIDGYICINSNILEKEVQIYTKKEYKIYSYEELSKFNKHELKNIFIKYFIVAKLNNKKLNDFINNLYLLVNNSDKYIDKVIDKRVIEDYKKGNKLNR